MIHKLQVIFAVLLLLVLPSMILSGGLVRVQAQQISEPKIENSSTNINSNNLMTAQMGLRPIGPVNLTDISKHAVLRATVNSNALTNSRAYKIIDNEAEKDEKERPQNNTTIKSSSIHFNPPPSKIIFNSNMQPKKSLSNGATSNTSLDANSSAVQSSSFVNNATRAHISNNLASVVKPSAAVGPHAFDGLSISDDFQLFGNSAGHVPPDISIAAGPSNLIEMTNNAFRIWDGNGNPLSSLPYSMSLGDLFSTKTDFISDPQVIYDQQSRHWFATILDGAGSSTGGSSCQTQACFVNLAVSSTDDPAKSWYVFQIPYGNGLPDQPRISTSQDKFVISVNWLGPFEGSQMFVADKDSLINTAVKGISCACRVTLPAGSSQPLPVNTTEISVLPAQSLSNTSCIYMVSIIRDNGVGQGHKVGVDSMCGNPKSGNLQISRSSIPMDVAQAVSRATSGRQPNKIPIDLGDGRITSAVYHAGIIWDGFNDICQNPTQACVHIQAIDVNNHKIIFQKNIVATKPDYDTYYPAFGVNSAGKMFFVFGGSSPESQPGIWLGNEDNPASPTYLVAGIGVHDCVPEGCRFGDYFGASSNPNGGQSWIAGEYGRTSGGDSHWATYVFPVP